MLFLKKNYWSIILFSITVLAAILRFRLLNDFTMDRDEMARVVPEFTFTSLIPPGIFFLTKVSAVFFNYSDLGFRFPSFIFGVLGVILIYFLGKTLFGKLEGILAAFVLAILLNPIVYSNQTKEYSPLIAFAALSSIFSFQIIANMLDKKKTSLKFYFLYAITSLTAIFFSSYFYLMVIFYQAIIISVTRFFLLFRRDNFKKIILKFPVNFLIALSLVFLVGLSYVLLGQMNKYFGLKIIIPSLTFIENYWHELGYFVTQDNIWTQFTNTLFLVSILFLLALKKYQRGAIYIIFFTALDFLLVSSLRFTHSAFPITYIRYHAFLLPTYIVMVAGVVGGAVFVLRKKHLLIALAIILIFLGFNIKRAHPMIRWYYESASIFINPNLKDDGAFLTANLKAGDTLVRVKNFGMDHKFNHVNHYIDKNIFKTINYSIFPERTAKNNWYAPLARGDEDEDGFSDYLFVERIRTSLRSNTPLISKLRYYGPFIKTRPLKDRDSWKLEASGNQETARLAIDQDIQTKWEGSTDVENKFSIDLNSIHTLNSIRFDFYPAYPSNFTIFLSEDNLDQTQIFNYDSSNPSHLNQQIFFPPTKARFIIVKIKNAGIREINIWEAYEDTIGINKEEVFVGESVVKYNFTRSTEEWTHDRGIDGLEVKDEELKGGILSGGQEAGVSVSLNPEIGLDKIRFINLALRVDKGKKAALILKTQDKDFLINDIPLEQNGLLNYYSLNLDDYAIPRNDSLKIRSITLFPSDVSGAEFGLDFLSLDARNLPGIQLRDNSSSNGFAQYIPYRKDDEYTFFQVGNKVNLPKGKYLAHFKIMADNIDTEWMTKPESAPTYRMHEYVEPKGTSDSDILYVSLESTRGTIYDSPAYLNIRGEDFKEKDRYYEFLMPFKSDGRETLFFQAFSPKNRRYPADLFITFPQIEETK